MKLGRGWSASGLRLSGRIGFATRLGWRGPVRAYRWDLVFGVTLAGFPPGRRHIPARPLHRVG